MIKSNCFYQGNAECGDKFLDCRVRGKLVKEFFEFSKLDGPGNQVSCTGEQHCKHDEVEDQRLWNKKNKKNSD